MFRHDHTGLGNLIQGLSRRMEDMQREITGLRQDIRVLTLLVREQSSKNRGEYPSKDIAGDE